MLKTNNPSIHQCTIVFWYLLMFCGHLFKSLVTMSTQHQQVCMFIKYMCFWNTVTTVSFHKYSICTVKLYSTNSTQNWYTTTQKADTLSCRSMSFTLQVKNHHTFEMLLNWFNLHNLIPSMLTQYVHCIGQFKKTIKTEFSEPVLNVLAALSVLFLGY